MGDEVIHIAGIDVRVGNQHRQRCAWCGAVIDDHDLSRLAVPAGQGPTLDAIERRRFDERGRMGVRLHPDRLDWPKRWRDPRLVFTPSLGDLFHADVPSDFICSVFEVMGQIDRHTYQVLTKRPQRMRELLSLNVPDPLPNVWLGTSCENQRYAGLRIRHLLATPAAVRFLSIEPLLGPVDLGGWLHPRSHLTDGSWHDGCHPCEIRRVHGGTGMVDWVIVGGESGPGARPMHPQWARDIRDQCVAAGVPYFFKQWGEWAPAPWSVRVCDPTIRWQGTADELARAKAASEAVGATHAVAPWGDVYEPPHKPWSIERTSCEPHAGIRRVGKKTAGRELDGRTWDQMPEGVA